jgi:hypothetical protein
VASSGCKEHVLADLKHRDLMKWFDVVVRRFSGFKT